MSGFDPAWRAALPSLRDVIAAHDLLPRKSMGQNFIFDAGITDKIAGAAGDVTSARIIEIGPGPGGLTRSLLSTAADQVVAIEFDPRAVAALAHLQAVQPDRLTVLQDDALAIDWPEFLSAHPRNIIVANLPYNISTALLAKWLAVIAAQPGLITRLVLMFQKEVADRLMAPVHGADYGRLSVLTQWLCAARGVMVLPPGAFYPPPKIHSTVVRFDPRAREDAVTWAAMDVVLTRAFAHRRKMLRSNLAPWRDDLKALGIDETLRAQDLEISAYLALAARVQARGTI